MTCSDHHATESDPVSTHFDDAFEEWEPMRESEEWETLCVRSAGVKTLPAPQSRHKRRKPRHHSCRCSTTPIDNEVADESETMPGANEIKECSFPGCKEQTTDFVEGQEGEPYCSMEHLWEVYGA